MPDLHVALIGFGEAGSTFAEAPGWSAAARAYDIDSERRKAMQKAGVSDCDTAADALADAQLALSLVTADAALQAATDYAAHLGNGAIFCDMNSVAPTTKAAAESIFLSAGKRYVDVAILAPVKPAALDVPLLISGEAAEEAADLLRACGFTTLSIVGPAVGRASAIKLVRSIMVKGMEALTGEMMLAAERLDVVEEVLESLNASERKVTWEQRSAYNLSRMREHGLRRAAEMEEAVIMLDAIDIEPVMTRGTVHRQRELVGNTIGKGIAT